jgi:catalase
MQQDHNDAQTTPASCYGLADLLAPTTLARLGLIGIVVLAVAAGFAWTAGWFMLDRLSRNPILSAFEADNGVHAGFRRNHAKGVCVEGRFDSTGAGAQLSRAGVFRPGRVPVFGRFALAGGMPAMPDGPNAVRSMALNFTMPNGEVWRTGMNDIPVFAVRDAQGFYDNLVALTPDPATGKPDPARADAFLRAHPESARAIRLIKDIGFASGFANATYNSLNAFQLVNAAGTKTPVRWSMRAVDAFKPEPVEPPEGKNYLFEALIARLREGPAQWHLVLIVGQPGDRTDDATIAWPEGRERVDAGVLTLDHIEAEAAGNCRDVNFDPLVLPSGIEPSDDPLLSARSAVYSASFTRRISETKSPSAIQTAPPGRKGG